VLKASLTRLISKNNMKGEIASEMSIEVREGGITVCELKLSSTSKRWVCFVKRRQQVKNINNGGLTN
jgi:hypothetical protein